MPPLTDWVSWDILLKFSHPEYPLGGKCDHDTHLAVTAVRTRKRCAKHGAQTSNNVNAQHIKPLKPNFWLAFLIVPKGHMLTAENVEHLVSQ